jgi:hypothetical protein
MGACSVVAICPPRDSFTIPIDSVSSTWFNRDQISCRSARRVARQTPLLQLNCGNGFGGVHLRQRAHKISPDRQDP